MTLLLNNRLSHVSFSWTTRSY